MRTRIKICGLTRHQDIEAAILAGADALGFVFYPKSPRYVAIAQAKELLAQVPPFVTTVGLFVNPLETEVRATLDEVPLSLLQFHGDETEVECARYARPFIKVARMRAEFDLLDYASLFPQAHGLLLDTFVESYGGSGHAFDWSLIPDSIPKPIILSGGLNSDNVAQAITRVRPYAVDVSSGVEIAKGIKDAQLIQRFVQAVRGADES